MSIANALFAGPIDAGDALQYVDNAWAFFGLAMLVAITAICVIESIPAKVRMIGVFAMCLLVMGFAVLSTGEAVNDVTSSALIHVVREGGVVPITPRVSVALRDVETLKGKDNDGETPGGHRFNRQLHDVDHVFAQILKRAGVQTKSVEEVNDLTQFGWDEFRRGLEKNKADRIVDIPFASFEVTVDSKKLSEFDTKWYFKDEELIIPVEGAEPVVLAIKNIYNTKHESSGEPEAVNVLIMPPPKSVTQP